MKRLHKLLIVFVFVPAVLYIFQCSDNGKNVNGNTPMYLNPNHTVEDRVNDLLGRMTLAEKIGQMTQVGKQFLNEDEDISRYYLGSLLSGGGDAPADNSPGGWAEMYTRFQKEALRTRLAIPILYGVDAVHGHNNVIGAVIFPHNIGLGATRNPQLVEKVSEITAREVAGTGINWTFAPCVAVPRDERWGRTYEGFGESPELVAELGAAAVRGYQGEYSESYNILACAKHYIGDGATANGIDQGDAQISEQELRNIHLPGYRTSIREGVGTIMASYSSWNGTKLHAHTYLLTDVLKDELGFKGFIISDYKAIDQLQGDYKQQIATSVNAGVDMVMVPDRYQEFIELLTELVNEGTVTQERLDDAVSRILRVKFEMGLFEQPLVDTSLTSAIGSESHRDVARQAVRESVVLLKNSNDILPLGKSLTRIHVAGKNADDIGNQCGGWTIAWQGESGGITPGTTILEGIRSSVPEETEVTYSRDGSGAEGADVAIIVIGETPYAEGRGDRESLALDPEDVRTINAVRETGTPVVVVLVSGRPLIVGPELPNWDAFLAAWLPGTEGAGVADVIFGEYNPTGKLPHTWPRSMNQVPVNGGDGAADPLFEYGYGLSYD